MSFLNMENKNYLIFGLANKKSVAYHCAKLLLENGANILLSVQDEARLESAKKLFGENVKAYITDLAKDDDIKRLAESIRASKITVHGILHSVAFAKYSEKPTAFHEVRREDFLQAIDISTFSLISISNHMKDLIDKNGSVVTVSISTTRMAAENYGYMAPVKAALDSSIAFLSKSFSSFSNIRFNAVAPSLLKTSASAGIPGYVDSYLYAEQIIPRKKALMTEEVAKTVLFILSDASSGIVGQKLVVDAGMSINYFDKAVVQLLK